MNKTKCYSNLLFFSTVSFIPILAERISSQPSIRSEARTNGKPVRHECCTFCRRPKRVRIHMRRVRIRNCFAREKWSSSDDQMNCTDLSLEAIGQRVPHLIVGMTYNLVWTIYKANHWLFPFHVNWHNFTWKIGEFMSVPCGRVAANSSFSLRLMRKICHLFFYRGSLFNCSHDWDATDRTVCRFCHLSGRRFSVHAEHFNCSNWIDAMNWTHQFD